MRLNPVITLSLVALLAAAPAAGATRVEVSIEGLKYKPGTIRVEVGDTIVWTNNDDRDHSIKASDGSFASGRLRSGKQFEHKFDTAGTFAYRDDLHPRMRGTVVVTKRKKD